MLEKEIKKESKPERENTILTDLCLDPYSRYKYLDKISHGKMEPSSVMAKKIQSLKERLPQKHHGYM